MKRGNNIVADALQGGYLPEVVDRGGQEVYSVANADKKALQAKLKTGNDKPISLRHPQNYAIQLAREGLGYDPDISKVEKEINNIFKEWGDRHGDNATLSTLTDMKRDVRPPEGKWDMPSLEKDARYYVGQGLMKAVEDTAGSRGIKGVRAINQRMGKIINIRRALGEMEGKSLVKKKTAGWIKEIAADIAGAGVGAAAEAATGGLTGGAAGFLGARFAAKRLAGNLSKTPIEKLGLAKGLLKPNKLQTAGLALPLLAGSKREGLAKK